MAEAKQKRELAKLISRLRGFRGSGTELVTVYIPAGHELNETTSKLKSEYGQAANIKSKTTRNNVQSALDRIIVYLKNFRRTPDNGLAIFSGNISKEPGKPDVQLFSLSPPQPLKISAYRCDSVFMLDPLVDMGRVSDKYGLIVIDGKEATVAILEGNVTKITRHLVTVGPNKTTKGGSSAARYQRYVEEKRHDYYRRTSEAMDTTLFNIGIKKVIVGGPGPVKENFLKEKLFNYQFEIMAVVDIGYSDEYGISELAKKAVDIVAEEKMVKEKKLLEKFMGEVGRNGLAVYGIEETLKALGNGMVGTLMLSEKFQGILVKVKCAQDHEREVFVSEEDDVEKLEREDCPEHNVKQKVLSHEELFDLFYDKAESMGVDVETITADNSDGQQFLAGFKGVGGLLRFK